MRKNLGEQSDERINNPLAPKDDEQKKKDNMDKRHNDKRPRHTCILPDSQGNSHRQEDADGGKYEHKNDNKDERSKNAHTLIGCVHLHQLSFDAHPFSDGVKELN